MHRVGLALVLVACGGEVVPPASVDATAPPNRTFAIWRGLIGIDDGAVRSTGGESLRVDPPPESIVLGAGSFCVRTTPGALVCVGDFAGESLVTGAAHVVHGREGHLWVDGVGAVHCVASGGERTIAALDGAVMVGAPGGSRCALSRTGRVACASADDRTAREIATGVVRMSEGETLCVIRADRTLACARDAGDGTYPTKSQLEPVLGAERIVDVVTSFAFVVTLDDAGAVRSFFPPEPGSAWDAGPVVLSDATELGAIDGASACARRRSGDIACWGAWGEEVLGPVPPTVIAGVEGAVDVTMGSTHACAATPTGVLCWGGVTPPPSHEPPWPRSNWPVESATPVPVDLGVEAPVEVELADGRLCARSEGGAIGCLSRTGPERPSWVPAEARVVELALPCVRTEGGDVYCADTGPTPLLRGTSSIAVDGDDVCGLRGRTIECTSSARRGPVEPLEPVLEGTTRLVGGSAGLCAVAATGRVTCAGGMYATTDLGIWDDVAAHVGRHCVWRAGEALRCGARAYEERRPATDVRAAVLTEVPEVTDVRAVALGTDAALALRADGTLVGWGIERGGNLGRGRTTWVAEPVTLPIGTSSYLWIE